MVGAGENLSASLPPAKFPTTIPSPAKIKIDETSPSENLETLISKGAM